MCDEASKPNTTSSCSCDEHYVDLGTGVCLDDGGYSSANYSRDSQTIESCQEFCTSFSECRGVSFYSTGNRNHVQRGWMQH
eukprot:UN15480